MNVQIDEKQCKKLNLTVSQLLILLSIKYSENFKDEFNSLLNKEAINSKLGFKGVYTINDKWNTIIDKILNKSVEIQDLEQWYSDVAKELSLTFPQGKMPNTAYYYRGNNKEISLKLKRFFKTHLEYKPSEEMAKRIINAATRYNKEMDLNPHYRVLAKYFISKAKTITDDEGIGHNEEVSLLATYLENEPTAESEIIENGDWLNTLKN